MNVRQGIAVITALVLLSAPPLQAANAIDLLQQTAAGTGTATAPGLTANNGQTATQTPNLTAGTGSNGGFSAIIQFIGGILQMIAGGFGAANRQVNSLFGMNFRGAGYTPNYMGSRTGPNGTLQLPWIAQSWGGDEARQRGCGPTSLLMAINQGRQVSQAEARAQIQPILEATCERPGGMVAERAVNWLHGQGWNRSRVANAPEANIDFLRQQTAAGNPVLVRILGRTTGNGHYVVVTGVGPNGVYVNDPGMGWKPDEPIPFQEFESMWSEKNNLSIVVQR